MSQPFPPAYGPGAHGQPGFPPYGYPGPGYGPGFPGYGPGPLPTPSVGFLEAVKDWIGRLTQFHGRSSRSQYWWLTLMSLLISIPAAIVMAVVGLATTDSSGEPTPLFVACIIVYYVFCLVIGLAFVPVGVRRLHDAGFSGWWYLLGVIPFVNFVGAFVVFVMSVMPSTLEGARFDGPTRTVSRNSP